MRWLLLAFVLFIVGVAITPENQDKWFIILSRICIAVIILAFVAKATLMAFGGRD